MAHMFRRKLQALDYHNPTEFNISNESEFRNLIVWLEDQKIRQYKIEDRAALRNVCAGDWNNAFQQYLLDLGYTGPVEKKAVMVDWVLGYAVRLEYGDNIDKFKDASAPAAQATSGKISNPLDNFDFNDPDVKAGIVSLSTLLQIPPHLDHIQVLKAVCILVQQRLSKDVVDKIQKEGVKPSSQIPMDKIDLGFEASDYISAEAAKILRLLHVKELRELQDSVNEAIVNVQKLTANPKTDTKLGKVGR